MSNRTLIALTIFVLIGIAILLGLNLRALDTARGISPYISPGEVRGVAAEYKGKLYTLNFSQQNSFLQYLNQSYRTEEKEIDSNSHPPITRIILYRFGKSDIEIIPIGLRGKNLLFSVPLLNPKGYLADTSEGALYDLLNTTHDP